MRGKHGGDVHFKEVIAVFICYCGQVRGTMTFYCPVLVNCKQTLIYMFLL